MTLGALDPPRGAPRYRVRRVMDASDMARLLRLRAMCFRGGAQACDREEVDDLCDHYLVERAEDGAPVAGFRVMVLEDGTALRRSYAAGVYDLSALSVFDGCMVELGRFCVAPGVKDPDILRVAWAELTRIVDGLDVRLLFGCSSFHGIDAESHRDAFALLSARYIAPRRWLPRVKAPDVVRFGAALRDKRPDMKQALAAMPPLLRSYLTMGGWVSDHAVVDRDLGTMHVFTGLEIAAIPAARKRALRAVAGLSA